MNEKTYYPVSKDLVFKTTFNDKELMQSLLEECFEKEIEIIEFMPTEQTIENKKEKHKRLDLVIKMEGMLVNVEVNTTYDKEAVRKNFAYLCKIHGQNIGIATSNIYQSESIQINLNLGQGDKSIKTEYIMYSPEEKEALDVRFKYIEINLDKYREFWYHKNDKKIDKYPILIAVSILKEEELNEFTSYSKNANVRKVRDKVKKINEDDIYASELSYEERKELEYLQRTAYYKETAIAEGLAKGLAEGLAEGRAEGHAEGLAEGRAEGRAEGHTEGLEQGKKEVAKNLLSLNTISLEDIAKSTGLSLIELKKLKEEI